jgi:hypothetical protein
LEKLLTRNVAAFTSSTGSNFNNINYRHAAPSLGHFSVLTPSCSSTRYEHETKENDATESIGNKRNCISFGGDSSNSKSSKLAKIATTAKE